MGFIVRLVLTFGKIAITVIVIALILYLTILLINRGVQWLGAQLGYEIGDFFEWAKSKLPRIKIERKIDDKKPENREIV